MMIKKHWKINVLLLSIPCVVIFLIAWNLLIPVRIKIAAGKENGDSHKFAKTIEQIIENNQDFFQQRIDIEVIRTEGTEENLQKLNRQEADLAMAQADLLAMPKSVRELQNLKPLDFSSTRLVSVLFPDAYQLIVRGDADINQITDLQGKKIMKLPEEGGQIQSFNFLMEHYGLSQQDYNLVDIGEETDAEFKAFCSGKIQAVFHVRAIGNENIRRLLTECPQANPKLLPIDQAEALKIKNPYLEPTNIPKGAYQGKDPIPGNDESEPTKELSTLEVQRLLLTHKNVNPHTIRRITEVLYEHRQDLIQKMKLPLAAHITSPDKSQVDIVATHRGAQWYYNREQPSWLEQNSGSLEVLTAIAIPLFGWFLWLFRQLEQARKDKADDYIREVTALIDADECLHTLLEIAQNQPLGKDALSANSQVHLIIDKIAKILVEKHDAEISRKRGLISQESVISFSRTLRKTIKFLEQSPKELADYIFTQVPYRAVQISCDRKSRQSRKNLIPAITGFNPSIPSFQKVQKSPQANLDIYQNALAKATTPNYQHLVNVNINPQLTDVETQLIRDDLEIIFKRAINALVEERISQDSFQVFRAIWQVAVDGLERNQGK